MFRKWKLQAKKVSFFENFDFSTHQSLSTSRESSFLALYIDLAICCGLLWRMLGNLYICLTYNCKDWPKVFVSFFFQSKNINYFTTRLPTLKFPQPTYLWYLCSGYWYWVYSLVSSFYNDVCLCGGFVLKCRTWFNYACQWIWIIFTTLSVVTWSSSSQIL